MYSGRLVVLCSVWGVMCCFVHWWYVRIYSGRAEVYGVATVTRIKVTKKRIVTKVLQNIATHLVNCIAMVLLGLAHARPH